MTSSVTRNPPARSVKTVVIPVAGRGLRLLPATKGIRKELMPVGREPLLLHAVKEAVASGAEHIVLVTSPDDTTVEKYLGRDTALEAWLEESGRAKEAAELRAMSALAQFSFVPQPASLGLADAIRCAGREVDGAPFGVILPDAFILSERPCIGQLMECHRRCGGNVIATRTIEAHETLRFGVLQIDPLLEPQDGAVRLRALVEKPRPECAPSLYGVFGRYILDPEIIEAINQIKPDASGELQLTDALNLHCQRHPVFGYFFEGRHFDTGSWLGYGEAMIECLLSDHEIGSQLCKTLQARMRTPVPAQRSPHPIRNS